MAIILEIEGQDILNTVGYLIGLVIIFYLGAYFFAILAKVTNTTYIRKSSGRVISTPESLDNMNEDINFQQIRCLKL